MLGMVQDGSGGDWADQERVVNIVSDAKFYRQVCTVINHPTILVCSDISIAKILLCVSPLGMREQAISLANTHIFRKQRARNKFHCDSKQAPFL